MADSMVEEVPEQVETVQQNGDPADPPKKLSIKDFAAKVKVKYPEYKDMDDTELTNRIISKHPEYKDQVDFGEVKKKSSGIVLPPSGSATPSNSEAQSQSDAIIPKVDIHKGEPVDNSIDGDMPGDKDILGQLKYANDLRKRTVESGADAELGGDYIKPDPEAISKADNIEAGLDKQGYGKDFRQTFSDIPDNWFNTPGFTKDELLKKWQENPLNTERYVAALKWQQPMIDAINKAQKDDPNTDYTPFLNTIRNSATDVNYSDKRNDNKALVEMANKIPDADARQKVLNNLAIDRQYTYGQQANNYDPLVTNSPNFNPYMNAGYDYTKDLHPSEIAQYDLAKVNPATLKDNPDAKVGLQEKQEKLETIGINLALNHAKENIASLTPRYNELLQKDKDKTITPDELVEAQGIEDKINKSHSDTDKANEAYNSFNTKYPAMSAYNNNEFAQELVGQEHTIGHPFMTLGNAVDNTYAGVENFVKSPFLSDEQNNTNQLSIIGQKVAQENSAYLTQDNQIQQSFKPTVDPDLQKKIDGITSNKNISYPDKIIQVKQLLDSNPGKFSRTPIDGGKTNLGLSALVYGVGDLAANLAPFMALETLTGGGATASAARKFSSAFASAAATSYQEQLQNAIDKGESNPYSYAFRNTVIGSLAMASAGTPDAIRELAATQKSAIKDLINGMTDAEITAAVKDGSKTFNTFKKVYGVGKNVVKGGLEGLKSGAKVNAFTTTGQVLNDAISGDVKAPQDYAKQALIETLKFGLFGAVLGGGKKIEKPSETTAAAIIEAGKNPEGFLNALKERETNGTITPKDAEQVRQNIEKSKTIINANPQINNLTDDAKREYVLNAITQTDAKDKAATLPPKDAAKTEATGLVAQYKNQYILAPKTDKQLETIKGGLEKQLIPEQDADGKSKEIPEKLKKETEAHLQAVNDIIDDRSADVADKVVKSRINTQDISSSKTNDNGKTQEADQANEIGAAKTEEPTTASDNKGAVDMDLAKAELEKAKGEKSLGIFKTIEPEAAIKMIAQQAQGITEKGDADTPENTDAAYKSTVNQFGKELVDAAIKVHPKESLLNESKATEVFKPTETSSVTDEGTAKESSSAEGGEGEKVGVHHAALADLSEKLGLPKPETGGYFTPEEHAARGRKLMEAGATVDELNNKANDLHDRISIGRAHLEKLVKELNGIRKEKGTDSQEYKDKLGEVDELRRKVKELGSAAGQAFTSLQGERDIDTDNFEVVKNALEEKQGKTASPEQEKKIAELTAHNEALVNHAIAAEKKLIEETEKAFNEGVEEGKKQKGTSKKSTGEKAKDIASKIREAKVHRPGSFSAATPASLIWDSAVEVVAKTIEAGGSVVNAIQKGISHIRESDWYKGLTEDKQEQSEDDFYDWHNEQTGLTDLQKKFADKKDNDLKFTPEDAKAVWDYGKSVYLDGGSSFRDMIKNVSNDTGLSYRQVSEAITTKKTKEVSNEMWAAQSDLKKGRKATENWIEQQGKNKIVRGFKTVMGVFRGISVFGHGAIFVGTHAGATLFDPKLSRSTQRAFVNGWKFAYGKTANYELAMEEFKDRPNYLVAQRAGLKNNPERINVEEFQRSQDFLRKIGLGKVATAGERGFNAIKVLRQDIFDYEYNKLSPEEKADPASATRVAELANNATGATNLKVPEVVNEVTFAGGMEASRWGRLITNPLKATATALEAIGNKITGKQTVTPSQAVFAKVWARRVGQQVATYAGALVANYGLQLLLNPKNPVNLTDPNKPDFLKFKFGNETIDPTSGVRSAAAFLYGLGKIPFESKKELHGDSPGQSFSKSVGGYARGKLAPGYGTVADFLSSQDYGGNTMPYSNEKPDSGKHKLTWGEYAWSKSPLPAAEAAQTIYQSARENGANESVLQRVLWGMTTGVLSGGTGFRVGESEPKKEPFDDKDKSDPVFKFYLDKGLSLPNTVHSSEKITNEKEGTKKTLADYPQDVQDKYDDVHKQFLKSELANMKGIVFVKTYKDAENNDVIEVSKKYPSKGKAVRKNISDLSKDELTQVLSEAQSEATKKTKLKIFGKN